MWVIFLNIGCKCNRLLPPSNQIQRKLDAIQIIQFCITSLCSYYVDDIISVSLIDDVLSELNKQGVRGTRRHIEIVCQLPSIVLRFLFMLHEMVILNMKSSQPHGIKLFQRGRFLVNVVVLSMGIPQANQFTAHSISNCLHKYIQQLFKHRGAVNLE